MIGTKPLLLATLVLSTGWLCLPFAPIASPLPEDPQEMYQLAQKQQAESNFKLAAESYRSVIADESATGELVAGSLQGLKECLQSLRLAEMDAELADAVRIHPDKHLVLAKAAHIVAMELPHYGYVIDQTFYRVGGSERLSGQGIAVQEQDRLQALKWILRAIELAEANDVGEEELARLQLAAADYLLLGRDSMFAWRLQSLTDLTQSPDYTDVEKQQSFATTLAPVDADGKPLLHQLPADFSSAQSDGQRLHWMLKQVDRPPTAPGQGKLKWAQFLESQFGVATLGNFNLIPTETEPAEDGIFALHTLQDSETIARLANGVQRFTLPEEFNHVLLYRQLQSAAGSVGETAARQLYYLYLNRRQYPQAADVIRQHPNLFPKDELQHIVGPRLRFEWATPFPAGSAAQLPVVFRNATQVQLTARPVDQERLIAEVKKYYRNYRPGQRYPFGGDPNASPPDLQNPEQLFTELETDKYLGPPTTWTVELEPRRNHWDRRTELQTPLSERGLYLVEAKSILTDEQGVRSEHFARTLVSIQDSVLIQKTLKSGDKLYQFADSLSGEPLAGANIEFFGWVSPRGRNAQPKIENFSRLTDQQGQVLNDVSDQNYQWLVIARGRSGQLSLFNFEYHYRNRLWGAEQQSTKAYGVSDRPVYRPGDTVHAKFWVARTGYAQAENTPVKNTRFHVSAWDPQGKRVAETEVTSDAFGGLEFDFDLPDLAMLGTYRFEITSDNPEGAAPQASSPAGRQRGLPLGVEPVPAGPPGRVAISNSLLIRVEEYRKPEYEVNILSPSKPVALGETIEARVQAKYYFGAPVTDAEVIVKVERTRFEDHHFPVMPYDWCYGPGYWWFADDYWWFPGFRNWCGWLPEPIIRPRFSFEPPELVLEQRLELDATGEAKISIDSALAKAVYGDSADHEYKISVEVRDASRRTITASGSVIAAREPFKVYTWVDRGYYRVGQAIDVHFQSRQLDGTPVRTRGKLDLLRIRYDQEGKPQEQLVETFEVSTDEDGQGLQTLAAAQAGQYRFRLRLEDDAEHIVEGGYVVTIRGEAMQGSDFRYAGLELLPDKMHYQPGETVQLQISADRDDAIVMCFVRPVNGLYEQPQLVRLENKSAILEIPVEAQDQPNFFVEAFAVFDGKVHQEVREIHVPPAEKLLDVSLEADQEEYLPGEEAELKLAVTADGQPQVTSCVIAVYDRSLEQIAPDVLPPDIREFFWKWQRTHNPSGRDSLQVGFDTINIRKIPDFRFLGAFGQSLADDLDAFEGVPLDDETRQARLLQNRDNHLRLRNFSAVGGMAGDIADFARGGEGAVMEMAPASAMLAEGMAVDKSAAPAAAGDTATPKVRQDFADAAYWIGQLQTDAQGKAVASFKMPENLTGWRIASWAVDSETRVGSAKIQTVTRKPLLVRLQLPRFLVERDEVVLSTIVHNDLATPQRVQVRLEIDGETQLELMPGVSAEQVVDIPAHEQMRVDWRCRALAEGSVTVRTLARSQEASDAMQLEMPIVVHGTLQTDSWAGTVLAQDDASQIEITIPEQRRIDQSRLTIRLSPSLAAAMMDALPYLASYPYECTEQTLNRFLPTVITANTLRKMNVDLEAIRKRSNNLNAQELGPAEERRRQWGENPVLDSAEVVRMAQAGVDRLTNMQNSDGGWGWFSGPNSRSTAHLTALVLRGLLIAQDNQVAVVPETLATAQGWLVNYQQVQLQRLQQWQEDQKQGKSKPDNTDALVFHVLTMLQHQDAAMQSQLYEHRDGLSVYGKCLLALATHALGNAEQTDMLRSNIEQFLQQDDENQTAYLRDQTHWWYWYGSSIESNAMYLKLLCKVDPQNATASRLVKYLLNNRKHADYWNSTRDTALVVEAFADYLQATNELQANMTVEAFLGDKRIGKIEFTPANLFEVNNTLELTGNAIPSGQHTLTLKRQGEGNLYWNVYATNFSLEDDIQPAGLEVKIERRYTLLTPVSGDLELADAQAQVVQAQQSEYQRTRLSDGMPIPSGALVEVELLIESKNDYEYLLVEDRKPAGLESVETASGYFYSGGLFVYRELREQHIGLCIERLPRGTYSLRYRLRSEAPGVFTALPASIAGMYAPELVGNSSDFDLTVTE